MVEIEILTAPACADCEVAKKRVYKVAEYVREKIPDLTVKITDITEHPEAVVKYGILTTPAIAIDGVLQFTKVPKEEELLRKIEAR
ncbi:MAG: thioredoxin family protein [Candidatus Bathyarchaeia archaeon]